MINYIVKLLDSEHIKLFPDVKKKTVWFTQNKISLY